VIVPAPREDGRTAENILREFLVDAPGYLPGWVPAADSSAVALLQTLARFSALVVQSLDDAADKGFLAYLDTLAIDVLPPVPARAPVVFSLSDGSPIEPIVRQGTQVAAPVPASLSPAVAGSGDPIIFATEQTVVLMRAHQESVFSLSPSEDKWADHTARLTGGFSFFDGYNQVPHCLYLGHDSLFALAPTAEVILDFSPPARSEGHRHQLSPHWEYLSSDGWVEFAAVEDGTTGLIREGAIKLVKESGAQPMQGKVNNVTSYWIRARVDEALRPPGGPSPLLLPEVQTLAARVSYGKDSLPLDDAFADGLKLDTSKSFRPFGTRPSVGTTFLVACDEAFKRDNARIGLHFLVDPNFPPTPVNIALLWEYSTGEGTWKTLASGEIEFHDRSGNFTTAPRSQPAVSFVRPADWQKVRSNGQSHYWLRVRVVRGDYGGPAKYEIDSTNGTVKVVNAPQPPILTGVSASYRYETVSAFPDHCLTQNLFTFEDHTDDCQWQTKPFSPFAAVPETNPAVYVGLDKALPGGLVSVYWDVGGLAIAGLQPKPSAYAWEYFSLTGWQALAVEDETIGLQVTGMLKVIGAPDQMPAPGPNGPLYWIRARRKTAAIPDPLPVNGIWTNATWVTQSSLHRRELASTSDGTATQVLRLLHPPVLQAEVVEVQEWRGGGREWNSLFAGLDQASLRFDTDPNGLVIGVWVPWQQRPHLFASTSSDRHYTIDRVNGLIRFGDGVRGMIPPPGSVIAVTYSSGSARAENVAAGAISQLHSSVPFVAGVTNPIAAAGGAAAEPISRIRLRGPAHLRAGARALAPADYECMAAEASAEVAIARCLPVTGEAGAAQPGWVTVAIVPWSHEAMPQPSAELLRRVRVHLASLVPAAISSQVRVVALSYLPISVEITLVAADPADTPLLESAVLEAVDRFLHPLTGGLSGNGWQFGDVVHLSQIARAIRQVPGLLELRSARFSVEGLEVDDSVTPGPMRLPASGRHVLRWEIGA
jgi:hypothetical protein